MEKTTQVVLRMRVELLKNYCRSVVHSDVETLRVAMMDYRQSFAAEALGAQNG